MKKEIKRIINELESQIGFMEKEKIDYMYSRIYYNDAIEKREKLMLLIDGNINEAVSK